MRGVVCAAASIHHVMPLLTGVRRRARRYTKPQSPPPHGGNLIFWDAGKNTKGSIVEALIQGVAEGLQNYKYIIIGQSNDYVAPTNNDTSAKCSESDVAAFLLAVEPGCFLLCNGYAAWQEYKLGQPRGPAKQDSSGTWTRSFAFGTVATWSGNTGTVKWGSLTA